MSTARCSTLDARLSTLNSRPSTLDTRLSTLDFVSDFEDRQLFPRRIRFCGGGGIILSTYQHINISTINHKLSTLNYQLSSIHHSVTSLTLEKKWMTSPPNLYNLLQRGGRYEKEYVSFHVLFSTHFNCKESGCMDQ